MKSLGLLKRLFTRNRAKKVKEVVASEKIPSAFSLRDLIESVQYYDRSHPADYIHLRYFVYGECDRREEVRRDRYMSLNIHVNIPEALAISPIPAQQLELLPREVLQGDIQDVIGQSRYEVRRISTSREIKKSDIKKAGYTLQQFVGLVRENKKIVIRNAASCCYAVVNISVSEYNDRRFDFEIEQDIENLRKSPASIKKLDQLSELFSELGKNFIASQLRNHSRNLETDKRDLPTVMDDAEILKCARLMHPKLNLSSQENERITDSIQSISDKIHRTGIRSLSKSDYHLYNQALRAFAPSREVK